MDIPKHIEDVLEKRTLAAEEFIRYDAELADWLLSNNIAVGSDHIYGGAVSVVEPRGSAEYIRECIRNT